MSNNYPHKNLTYRSALSDACRCGNKFRTLNAVLRRFACKKIKISEKQTLIMS
jgi:hypothetical protein